MCLAIPAQITELDGARAKVELSGNVLDADLSLIEDAREGDWVLLHAGFAIEKLEPEDAEETLKLFAEMGEATGDVPSV
ncbi:MAG: HypC/HybG/HupF family hydrogenase formation chaperone [Candidatus Hydrogenedentes bacterium]|nr:HypC/HybG/HupF family hydrogenase formation chaperone [Candidatus Hydrogenedentota bacterium]